MAKLTALQPLPELHFDGNGNVAPENQDNDLATVLNTMKARAGGEPSAAHVPATGEAPLETTATVRVAAVGELVLYDPTAQSVNISAPPSPNPGDSFAIKNQSTHATNGALVSPHAGGQIEDPGSAGALLSADTATAAIVAAGNVTKWQYLVTSVSTGWWVVT